MLGHFVIYFRALARKYIYMLVLDILYQGLSIVDNLLIGVWLIEGFPCFWAFFIMDTFEFIGFHMFMKQTTVLRTTFGFFLTFFDFRNVVSLRIGSGKHE